MYHQVENAFRDVKGTAEPVAAGQDRRVVSKFRQDSPCYHCMDIAEIRAAESMQVIFSLGTCS